MIYNIFIIFCCQCHLIYEKKCRSVHVCIMYIYNKGAIAHFQNGLYVIHLPVYLQALVVVPLFSTIFPVTCIDNNYSCTFS
ncbi:hypothetical protein GDO81_011868 [Engystomops pustulosus]|uniref:Uncharacterized protein n=1 Tax=Engystomops pustulosus TaxID=76066 RepID=A0AAV7BHB8_ENGPU|nr:hypothetical protein GDO81_011868 [Engystomops pustulosus]